MSSARALAIAFGLSLALHGTVFLLWGGLGKAVAPRAAGSAQLPVEMDVLRLAGVVAASPLPVVPAAHRSPDSRRVAPLHPASREGTSIEAQTAGSEPAAAAVAVGVEASPGAAEPGNPPSQADLPAPAPLDTSGLSRRLQEGALRCYPPAARRFRQTGEAQVRFCLDPAGTLSETTLAASSGSSLLDHAASDCVVPGAAPFGPETFGHCFTLPVRFGQ